jgi:hypothetical protein
MIKPTRVLCKRSETIGDDYYIILPAIKVKRDNRLLVKGDWYNVVYNENDTENTFTIIDNQGHLHLHYMYTEEDKKDWPSFCKKYGPRDYAKWFYTTKELRRLKINKITSG